MSELLTLIRVGDTPRMGTLLHKALTGIPYEEASPQNQALHNRRILFVVGIDNQGPGTDFYRLVRWLLDQQLNRFGRWDCGRWQGRAIHQAGGADIGNGSQSGWVRFSGKAVGRGNGLPL